MLIQDKDSSNDSCPKQSRMANVTTIWENANCELQLAGVVLNFSNYPQIACYGRLYKDDRARRQMFRKSVANDDCVDALNFVVCN